MSYILFDIGGTNTRVTVSEDLKSFEKPVKFKTPVNFKEGMDKMVEAAKGLKGRLGVRLEPSAACCPLSAILSLTMMYCLSGWRSRFAPRSRRN